MDIFHGQAGKEYDDFFLAVPYWMESEEKTKELFSQYSGNKRIRAIELGCGTGISTKGLLSCSAVTIDAIDVEQTMIEQAAASLEDYVQSGRLTLTTADALEYLRAVPSESIDAVVSVHVMHNCPAEYRRSVWPQIARVLKSEGLYINTDKIAHDDSVKHLESLADDIQQLSYYDHKARPDLQKEWIQHYLRDNQPQYMIKESECMEELRAAGLTPEVAFRKQMSAIITGKRGTQ